MWTRIKHIFDPKRLAIVVGGLLAIGGSAGQFFFVQSLSDEVAREVVAMDGAMRRIEVLKNAQIQYFMAYQQGAMLFAMDPSGVTRDKEVLANLYRLNLVNRSTPLRAMLGEIAIAGAVNYRAASDAYQAVNEAARKELTWDNYSRLNEFERQIIDAAMAQQEKQDRAVLEAQARKAGIEARLDRRKLTLVLLSLFGSTLILVANLLSDSRERRQKQKAAAA